MAAQLADGFERGKGIQDAEGIGEAQPLGPAIEGQPGDLGQILGRGAGGVLAADAHPQPQLPGPANLFHQQGPDLGRRHAELRNNFV